MTCPAVSVVLPVHNGEPHIHASVHSILDQTFSDFELVICNDGSDDGTGATIGQLATADPRIRLCHRAIKSGVAAAANWAVSEARAPLVAIAHADDLWHPNRLAPQMALMKDRADCVLTGSPADAIDWHGAQAHPANLWRLVQPSVFAPMAHSSILFRKAAFDAAGGYREAANYWEDLDLYWRIARYGKILVLVQPLITYRYSRISIRERDATLGVERALEKMYRSADAIEEGSKEPSRSLSRGDNLHPRVFVARSWSRLWAGEHAIVLPQMLRNGMLRFDRATVESLGFVLWATFAPRSLRCVLRRLTGLRNRSAKRRLGQAWFVEWDPLHRALPRRAS